MSQINLKKNILMSGSFRLIVMFVSFITSVFSTRFLGLELKGQFSYLFTLSGFVWMTLDMGLYRSYPYLVRKHPDKIGTLYTWSVLQFAGNLVILSAVGISLLGFWSRVIGFNFNPLIIVFFVSLISLSQFNMQLQSLYLGLDKVFKHSIAQLINSLAVLLFVLTGYLYFSHADRLAYLLTATIIAAAICTVFYILNNNWGKAWKQFSFRFVLSSYKAGFRVFLSTLFIMLLIRFDIILIKRFLGYSEVGIYSIAAHIIDLLQIASNLVGGLLLVKLSDSKEDVEKWLIMKKLLMAFFIFLAAANLGFAILGKFLISTLYGIQFLPVYDVFLWLIPASFGLSFGSLFNMYLNSKGFPIISIILPAIALVTNILLNLILIPVWGVKGAAISTSFSYLFWFFSIILYEQKKSRNHMIRDLIPRYKDWSMLLKEVLLFVREYFDKLRTRSGTKNVD
jgi:O-antigen/teichoic acid export membrane protein